MESTNFWKCVYILINNYHTINKKVFDCKITKVNKVVRGFATITFDPNEWFLPTDVGDFTLSSGMEIKETSEQELMGSLKSTTPIKSHEGFIISFRFLMKGDHSNIEALGFVGLCKTNFLNTQYSCIFRPTTFDDFQIAFISGKVDVVALSKSQTVNGDRWLNFVLKPKLEKWYNSKQDKTLSSLHLVDKEIYIELYKKLKTKYSAKIFSIWPECTDPIKFIYEDMAIATYLICIWQKYNCSPRFFADLGCGNGLLVYILHQEGYKGCGYDVRSRKIWSLFPENVLLFEKTIVPSNFHPAYKVDWIIGNHSDELSPWIPVIAALSSYNTKYFLLPCCAFEFSGVKFQRRNSRLSSYNDFMHYVENISHKCGFHTLKDRLKIPSTKRIALLGISRRYVELRYPEICSNISEYFTAEIKENTIKLREKSEAVRNCTQINSEILDSLVKKIFIFLLEPKGNDADKALWNKGAKRTFKEIAQYLLPEDLRIIKSECGGIKTLIKNRHEIFEVMSGDYVQIRTPVLRDTIDKKPLTVKKRLCFFTLNHPNGCPLSGSDCTFIH